MTSRKTIAIDCDEVLQHFVKGINKYRNEKYQTKLTEDDYHSYAFVDTWKCSTQESMKLIYEYIDTDYFKYSPTVSGSLEGVKKLKEYYDLVVVTSRETILKKRTIDMINKEFPNCFKKVLFTSDDRKVKREICLNEHVYCLIDDSLKYVTECAPCLEKVILFGDYAWNQTKEKLSRNVVRCKNWDEVLKILIPNK